MEGHIHPIPLLRSLPRPTLLALKNPILQLEWDSLLILLLGQQPHSVQFFQPMVEFRFLALNYHF